MSKTNLSPDRQMAPDRSLRLGYEPVCVAKGGQAARALTDCASAGKPFSTAMLSSLLKKLLDR